MISPDKLQEWRKLEQAATPGPWKWRYPQFGSPVLTANPWLIVMDFVRKGMQYATARFAVREPNDVGGILHKVEDLPEYTPDKQFIAESREIVKVLLDEIDMLLIKLQGRETDLLAALYEKEQMESALDNMAKKLTLSERDVAILALHAARD